MSNRRPFLRQLGLQLFLIGVLFVVLLPIFRKESDRESVMAYVEKLARELKDVSYHGQGLQLPRFIGRIDHRPKHH